MKKASFKLVIFFIVSSLIISCNNHFKGDESKYKGDVGFMPVDNDLARKMIGAFHNDKSFRIEQIKLTKDETRWLIMDKRTVAVRYCGALYPDSKTCNGGKNTVLVQLKKKIKGQPFSFYYYDLCQPKVPKTQVSMRSICPEPPCREADLEEQ